MRVTDQSRYEAAVQHGVDSLSPANLHSTDAGSPEDPDTAWVRRAFEQVGVQHGGLALEPCGDRAALAVVP